MLVIQMMLGRGRGKGQGGKGQTNINRGDAKVRVEGLDPSWEAKDVRVCGVVLVLYRICQPTSPLRALKLSCKLRCTHRKYLGNKAIRLDGSISTGIARAAASARASSPWIVWSKRKPWLKIWMELK